MTVKRPPTYTARTLPPDLRVTSAWPSVEVSALDEPTRERFWRLKGAIQAYIDGGKLSLICRDSGLSRSTITRQLNRCVRLQRKGGEIVGWRALIPYYRSVEQSYGPPTSGGARTFPGELQRFFSQRSHLRDRLDDFILRKPSKKRTKEEIYRAETEHQFFVRICQEDGVKPNEYPLNTKSQAKRSISRYKHALISDRGGSFAVFDSSKTKRPGVGNGYQALLPLPPLPYDAASIDAHRLDCIGTVIIPTAWGSEAIPFSRMWLISSACRCTGAILGYRLYVGDHPDAEAIEHTLRHAITKWKRWTFETPGVAYEAGAGFPSCIPGFENSFPAILTLDNALEHLAERIIEKSRVRLGCTFSFGAIGNWAHSSVQERLHSTLEYKGFRRLPSSTGTGPEDPKGRDAVNQAISNQLEFTELKEYVESVVANYNATPVERFGNRSPLQMIQAAFKDAYHGIIPRPVGALVEGQAELGTSVVHCKVAGNNRGRAPYIQVDRLEYSSPKLAHDQSLIGKSVILHIPDDDIRVVKIFRSDGTLYGDLEVKGKWRMQALSRSVLKAIKGALKSNELLLHEGAPPSVQLADALVAQIETSGANKKRISRPATKLANLMHHEPAIKDHISANSRTVDTSSEKGNYPMPKIVQPSWKNLRGKLK